MGQEQSGYIGDELNSVGGGATVDYGSAIGGDNFAIDYPDFYAGASNDVPFGSYDPNAPESQLTEPNYVSDVSPPGSPDLFQDYLSYYLELGYNPLEAASLAAQDASSPAFQLEGSAPLPLPDTSDVFLPSYPYQTPYARLDTAFTAPFPYSPAPAPPLPRSPATQQPNLPGACPGGTYHPYPIGDPQQDLCVPFPPAPTGQASKASAPTGGASTSGGGGASSSKPPATPANCVSGQYYSTRQRRCVPIPQCPTGLKFDPALETCVRATAQTSLLPPLTGSGLVPQTQPEDIFGGLKNVPLWVWAALAALLLLGGGNEEKKKVTIQHRRAT